MREEAARGRESADPEVAARWRAESARLAAVEDGLCFGRLEMRDGSRRYIGRLGLFEDGVDEPLLLDWRRRMAQPFYTATMAEALGVRRRRRITTRGRVVAALDDELFDPGAADPGVLVGEAALLAALTADRTGRMGDIVTTLQAEQDRIVRDGYAGVLVVQGGPGTGKTAVALHRLAYLMYTRPRLRTRGVLVIGPSDIFLDYIGQVLPGLGEQAVVTATVAGLRPGVEIRRVDPVEATEGKGRAEAAGRIAAAVWGRVEVAAGTGQARSARAGGDRAGTAGVVAGERRAEAAEQATAAIRPEAVEVVFEQQVLRLEPAEWRGAIEFAVRKGLPYQQARLVFQQRMTELLAQQLADRLENVVFTETGEALDGGTADGRLSAADLRALEAAGVVLGPEQDDGPRRLLDEADVADLRKALLADVAVGRVLDGLWPSLTAEAVVAEVFGSTPWSAADIPLLDEAAAVLGESAPAFGHVVVDEAQELSAMAWRMVLRRCPGKSMTVVGDLAQTSDPAGAASWEEVLRPHVADRWRVAELSVNYRTPAEIMAVASELSAAPHPRSVRKAGESPWRVRSTVAELERIVRGVAEEHNGGQFAVIAPPGRLASLREESAITVLTPAEAKGLEFDSVLIVDPARILEAPRGRNDLYVAMTRATRRLGIVHLGPAPDELAQVKEVRFRGP